MSVNKFKVQMLMLQWIIYKWNSTFRKVEYSQLQYHWCPIVFKVITGLLISSIKYRRCKEGMSIKIKIIAGALVPVTSISSPNKNRLVNLL